MNALVTEARKLVKGTIDDDDNTNAALRSIIEVGTSAGGARAKAVVAWNPKTKEIRSGQMDAPEGFHRLRADGYKRRGYEINRREDYGLQRLRLWHRSHGMR